MTPLDPSQMNSAVGFNLHYCVLIMTLKNGSAIAGADGNTLKWNQAIGIQWMSTINPIAPSIGDGHDTINR